MVRESGICRIFSRCVVDRYQCFIDQKVILPTRFINTSDITNNSKLRTRTRDSDPGSVHFKDQLVPVSIR